MKRTRILLFALASIFLFSCVSKKKYVAEQKRYTDLNTQYTKPQGDLKTCEDQKTELTNKGASLQGEIDNLNKQLALVKENNTTMLNQLKDMSVISAQQADNIKKSLDNIGAKDIYIQDLQKQMAQKDSLNMALVMNLKGALADVNDQDVEIKVEKGVVLISISDKMLFKSGSYIVNERAKEVLGKVAQVINGQPDVQFLVEGHTDNKPIKNACIADNWDLSVKRATSVVRILVKDHNIDPARIIAGGRGEFVPIAANDTPEGRTTNRRTRIVIQPELDKFFQLLEPKAQTGSGGGGK
jgi:chemotaxis protein MotB